MNSIEAALKNNTYWENISIGNKIFKIRRVKNIDRLIDSISEEEYNQDERLPYWAEIWPSSIALSEYILEHKEKFTGKYVLELGCGLGLVGIVLTSIGCDVLFTDYDSFALQFTQENFERNFNRPASVQLLDWRDPGDIHNFDIIVAADIIYEKRWLEPIVNVIDKKMTLLGKAYLADPDRSVGREIVEIIAGRNWQRQSLLKATTVYNKLHHIVIHRISKC